jgi:4'-phosphopantetheinyl transferase
MEALKLSRSNFNIDNRECHIWSLSLELPPDVLPAPEQVLSEEERQRAAAFLLPTPQRQFILARAALRTLLGRYLATPPTGITFNFSAFGKPFLQSPSSDLHFNIAHSGTQILIAVARAVEIGVDIEIHRPLGDLPGLAKMVFANEEILAWQRLSDTDRVAAFYAIWSRKEAVAKAAGQGLSMEFTAMEVSFEPDQAPELRRVPAGWGNPQEWTLQALDAASGYSAALAARARGLRVSRRTFAADCALVNSSD